MGGFSGSIGSISQGLASPPVADRVFVPSPSGSVSSARWSAEFIGGLSGKRLIHKEPEKGGGTMVDLFIDVLYNVQMINQPSLGLI